MFCEADDLMRDTPDQSQQDVKRRTRVGMNSRLFGYFVHRHQALLSRGLSVCFVCVFCTPVRRCCFMPRRDRSTADVPGSRSCEDQGRVQSIGLASAQLSATSATTTALVQVYQGQGEPQRSTGYSSRSVEL